MESEKCLGRSSVEIWGEEEGWFWGRSPVSCYGLFCCPWLLEKMCFSQSLLNSILTKGPLWYRFRVEVLWNIKMKKNSKEFIIKAHSHVIFFLQCRLEAIHQRSWKRPFHSLKTRCWKWTTSMPKLINWRFVNCIGKFTSFFLCVL